MHVKWFSIKYKILICNAILKWWVSLRAEFKAKPLNLSLYLLSLFPVSFDKNLFVCTIIIFEFLIVFGFRALTISTFKWVNYYFTKCNCEFHPIWKSDSFFRVHSVHSCSRFAVQLWSISINLTLIFIVRDFAQCTQHHIPFYFAIDMFCLSMCHGNSVLQLII